MTKSQSRDRPTTDLEAKASSSPLASSRAQALPCAASAVCSACGAKLPSHRASDEAASSESSNQPCVVTSEMNRAGRDVLENLRDDYPSSFVVEEVYKAMWTYRPTQGKR